jgi:hypothetical protein
MNFVFKEFRNLAGRGQTKRPHAMNVVAALTGLLALVVIFSPTKIFAQEIPYTAESLEGDYAFVGAYSGDVARLVGTAHFDGRGDLTSGSARVVIVGGTVKSISYNGQYSVNPDGTGTMTLSVFGVATPPPTVTLDFVISKARFTNGTRIATEIQDALEGPSVVVPGQNSFVTHVFTRRPDRERRR